MPWMEWINTLATVLVIALPIAVLVAILAAGIALLLYFVVIKKLLKKADENFKRQLEENKRQSEELKKQSEEQRSYRDYFTKSKAREVKPGVVFKDFGGVPKVKEEVGEILEFLERPEKFREIGARMPRGVLLYGPPGTGKTLLAKALAGEAKVKFFSVSGSEFNELFWGVGSSRVGNLFEELKKEAPCIIFFDEIDAMGGKRSSVAFAGEKAAQETLNQLLHEMDGFDDNSGVIIIGATNRQDILDPALTRKGRFDRQIYVPNPDKASRKEILKIHLKKVKYSSKFDIGKAVSDTFGCSGADIENMVNEAAILAARKNKKELDNDDFDEANIKVKMGLARTEREFTKEQKRILAYHEAGHAIIAIKSNAPVNRGKISIIPHGEAAGFNMIVLNEEKLIFSRKQCRDLIATGLGGRAAETIVFKDFSLGAREDIKQVTAIAKQMVSEWGMSDEIGPLRISKDNFLAAGMSGVSGGQLASGASHACSEFTAQTIDKEMQIIVKDELKRAIDLLNESREALDESAELLIKKETIESSEVEAILGKHKKTGNGSCWVG